MNLQIATTKIVCVKNSQADHLGAVMCNKTEPASVIVVRL